MTTIVFGFAAETAVIRLTCAADIAFTAEIVCPSYGVPGGDTAHYPECDMVAVPGGSYTKRDGTPYPKQPRRSA